MRVTAKIVLVASALLVAAGPAGAAQLTFLQDNSAYSAYASQPIERPWAPQRPAPQLVQRPIAEIIATRLGIAQGSAELFRYRLENAPSNATVLNGQIDGGGIRLKLSW